MKKRIFRSMCGIAVLCVVLSSICVTGVLYKFSFDSMRLMIRDEAAYIVASLNQGNTSSLEATQATFTRLTLIDVDGSVLFDSVQNASEMENHANRPEVAAAFQAGASEAQRHSETLSTSTYYRAVRLQNGQVVRLSGSMDSVWATAFRYLPYLLLALLVAVVLSAFSARYLASRIATPLNEVNLDEPLSNDVYEELTPLLRRMEEQRVKIEEQFLQMEERSREFSAITSHMREGLILLGKHAEVLSVNRSALTMLGLEEGHAVGKHILYLSREEPLQKLVEESLSGKAGEGAMLAGGRHYQLLANPVLDGNTAEGAVLLLLDVTDRMQAEQMRREFTANVSHELKTPLTSISGFAELIKDGMAQEQDIPQFAERIYAEARRLMKLVEKVLRLSRLDEKNEAELKEPVRLLKLAQEISERLQPQAEKQNVTVWAGGEEVVLEGVPHILEELLYNLCDNAIKYNRTGGRVDIQVAKGGSGAQGVVLTVSDTGIGIPAEHQERIFERFYRVDKSHAKETGGTGLGLSIVKHGALFHQAELMLTSKEGQGTQVQISF